MPFTVHLQAVLDELLWDGLPATQWKNLETIKELLQSFARNKKIASTEQSTSIGMIYPLIKELSLHFKEISKNRFY